MLGGKEPAIVYTAVRLPGGGGGDEVGRQRLIALFFCPHPVPGAAAPRNKHLRPGTAREPSELAHQSLWTQGHGNRCAPN